MEYSRNKSLGFDKEAVLLLSGNSDSSVTMKQPAFKQSLLQTPGIQSVSFNTDAPSSENSWTTNFAFDHREDEKYQLSLKFADEDYFKTFGIQLAAGNFYSKSDTAKEIVINETLVKKLGLKNPDEAIGKLIRSGRSDWKPIVGVVKDFKLNSLREEMKPLMLMQRKDRYSVTGTFTLVIAVGPMFVTFTFAEPLAFGPRISVPVLNLAVVAAARSGSVGEPTVSVNDPSVAAGAELPAASLIVSAGRSTVYWPLSALDRGVANVSRNVATADLPLPTTVTNVAVCGEPPALVTWTLPITSGCV
jgi:hypothetical protein